MQQEVNSLIEHGWAMPSSSAWSSPQRSGSTPIRLLFLEWRKNAMTIFVTPCLSEAGVPLFCPILLCPVSAVVSGLDGR